MSLAENDALKWARKLSDVKDLLISTRLGFASRIPAFNITATGRMAKGVLSLKMRDGDQIADFDVIPVEAENTTAYVVAVTDKGYGKRIPIDEFVVQRRGGKGVIAIKFKGKIESIIFICWSFSLILYFVQLYRRKN